MIKFRDPATTTASIVAALVFLAQATGLLDHLGASAEQFGDLATKLVAFLLALVAFLAKDSDTMRRLPGVRRLQAPDDQPTLFERATGTAPKPTQKP